MRQMRQSGAMEFRLDRRDRRRFHLRMCLRRPRRRVVQRENYSFLSILHVLQSYSYISQLILLPIGGGEYFPYLGQGVPTVA